MARKSRQSFLKRQRERKRVEKAALKRAKRQARRDGTELEGTEGLEGAEGAEDTEGGFLEAGEADLDESLVTSEGSAVRQNLDGRDGSPGS